MPCSDIVLIDLRIKYASRHIIININIREAFPVILTVILLVTKAMCYHRSIFYASSGYYYTVKKFVIALPSVLHLRCNASLVVDKTVV